MAESSTRRSNQTTKDRGRGKLSRRSDGEVATAKARTTDSCRRDCKAGKPAIRAIHARALSGPAAKPCLLMRVASQSGRAPGGGSCGSADSAWQKEAQECQSDRYRCTVEGAKRGVLHVHMRTGCGHGLLMEEGGFPQRADNGEPVSLL